MPSVLIPLADGFEDIEAIAVIDILRRAGIDVVTAGERGNIVTSHSNIKVHTDARLIDMENFSKYDGIILPGGPGYENLMKNQRLLKVVEQFATQGKFVGAICGAPLILAKLGLLKEKRATIYPGLEKYLNKPRGERVVVDGNIVTSQGPGTAVEFALKIVEQLLGKAKADQLKHSIVA